MTPPEDASTRTGAPVEVTREAERLYQAAQQLEAHHDPTRHVEALKGFLAYVESNRRPLAPRAEELSRWLDEAAMSLYRRSQAELAGRAIEVGLGFAPNSATLLHHKALILLTQNRNIDFVLPLLERAISINPHDKAIWATKGDLLRLQGRPEAAIEAYLHAQQLDPGSMQYVDRALKLNPQHAGALRVKLQLARAHGGERPALEACEALLAEAPDDPELLLTKADILVALGCLEEATGVVEKVRQKRPDDPRTSEVYARLLFALDRSDAARQECRRLLEAKVPVDPVALADLAERVARTGTDAELALALRARVHELDPRNIANLQALRTLAISSERLELAIEASHALLDVSPKNLDAMRELAELLLRAGRPDPAFQVYREMAQAHPKEIPELRKAMVAAQSAERPDLVREFAAAILKESPSDVPSREQLARALAASGAHEDALKAYEELLANRPGELRYLLEKKRLLVELQRTAELPAVYDELFRLDPTRGDIALERGNLYLAQAYRLAEGSVDRATAARSAMVSYERASLSSDRRSSALLGLARAARIVHMHDRAVAAYQEFLNLPGNDRRPDAHKELGHILREANRFRDAEAEYTQAIQLGLEDVDLLWGEVEALTQLNNEASALRYLDLLLLKDPQSALFLRRKGQLLLKLGGRRQEALQALTSAVHAAGGDPHIYFDIAGALRGQGAYADAIQYYEQGLALDPKSRSGRIQFAEALLQAGRYDDVIPQVDRLLHEDPNDLGAWRIRADAYRALHRTPDLLYSLKAILLLDPNHPGALLEKGRLHLSSGQKPEAFEALQRLAESGSAAANDPALLLELADLASELGRTEEANRAYDRAVQLDGNLVPEVAARRARLRLQAGRPDLALELVDGLPTPAGGELPVPTLLLRADILSALERPSEAQAVYETIRRRDPRNREAVLGLGRMLLEQGKPKEARELVREALPQQPADAQLFLVLAEADGALGSLAEAVVTLEQAVKAIPESVPLWTRLAEVFIRKEEWPKASDALAHAMALDPANGELPLRAGFVAEKLGHAHEALALYEHATEIAPSNKYAWSSRGLAFLSLGRPEEALPSFDRALGLDSDFEAAKEGRKAALQKTREGHVERFGRDALLLEAKLGRPVTRNDLFVTLHVPYDLLEPVLAALARTPKINLDRLSEQELTDLEAASCQLVTSALEHRPEGLEHRGLTLADVAVLAPANYTLAELQRLFGYIRSVLELDLRPENLTLTADVEDLARRALLLPEEQRTLFQLVRTLRVGLYKARVIKAVERAGGAVHAPLPSVDLTPFTPEFSSPAPPPASAAPAPLASAPEAPTPLAEPDLVPPAEAFPAPAPPSAPIAAAPAAGAGRCLGCGGIPAVVHSCGALLCHHCIAQYHTCPKCGLAVRPDNSRTLRSGAPPARPSVAPTRAKPTGGLRGLFNRGKTPPPGRSSAAPPSSPPARGRGAPPAPARPGPANARPTPPPETDEEEAPAPPPPPRPRERRDDEPRL
jgi:tetratricopeptide (TPR) repeat protein